MRETFAALTCERCGLKSEIRGSNDLAGWGRMRSWLDGYVPRKHDQERHADIEFVRTGLRKVELCPNCFEGLRDWWLLGEAAGRRVRNAIAYAGGGGRRP